MKESHGGRGDGQVAAVAFKDPRGPARSRRGGGLVATGNFPAGFSCPADGFAHVTGAEGIRRGDEGFHARAQVAPRAAGSQAVYRLLGRPTSHCARRS